MYLEVFSHLNLMEQDFYYNEIVRLNKDLNREFFDYKRVLRENRGVNFKLLEKSKLYFEEHLFVLEMMKILNEIKNGMEMIKYEIDLKQVKMYEKLVIKTSERMENHIRELDKHITKPLAPAA